MRDLITEPISDAGLLERFASHRDEAAFGELVKRHGPQVLKVCRRGLPSEHDVEDVFQATFFVLAHKAAAVSWNESVESWLCAVARRLVLHARASAWQRQSRERPITALGGARAGDGQVSREREQVEALARKAQWVAEQTADQDPGRSSELWLFHAAKMRLAALDLGQAARIGDRAALLSAARQLDTTCIGCHEIFRH